jgi:hypothetical protein
MYKIIDLQIEGREFANGALFNTKSEVVDQLASYHDIDFSGTDDKDNELDIWDYFKFWKINTVQKKLDWLLNYGQWELREVKIVVKRLPDVLGINRHRRWIVAVEDKEGYDNRKEIISTNEDVLGAKYYIGEREGSTTGWFKTFKEAKEELLDLLSY